ncbi:matrix extracellular phosphoglycoprotein [Sarcophilus harrisii]|uniref:Matrix extracellular phosphoglycoprotein n=1 Tax=Sarcophilus harrisii TaxID=9305 RepID=G3VN78_SARHA|nr:matrix extracellular phosphoglycoprotein [Sarcophilus harrisii]
MQVILLGLCFLSVIGAVPQKENNKNRVPVHYFDKGKKQEVYPKRNVIQKSDKSQDVSAGKQTVIKEQGTDSSKISHHDLEDTIYAEFIGNAKTDHGESVIKDPPDQKAHGVILINKNGRKYANALRRWIVEETEQNETGNSIHNKLKELKYSEAQGKGDEDIAIQNQNISEDHRTISHVQYINDHSKLTPKHIKFPYDFEGSGQGKEDNDFSPSSREIVVPDTETINGYTSVPHPDNNNAIDPNSILLIGKEGNNEVPEKEVYDLNSNGRTSTGDVVGTDSRKTPRKENSITDNKIVRESNAIRGGTNYRELPGKEGEANTSNTYQESVGIHPSQGSMRKQNIGQHAREGSNDIIEGKEISKYGKDNTKAGIESSKRDQKTKNDKGKKFGKEKSQGLPSPSNDHTHPLKAENERKNEENVHYGYNKERSIPKLPSNIRKNHYAAHRRLSSTKSHRVPGRKRFWGHTNSHSNKKFKPPKRNDSSDSTSSDSSDSDSDQSTEYFQSGNGK